MQEEMYFEGAKEAALKEILAEVPDNGVHMLWINAKAAAVRRMTFELYNLTIHREEKEGWDEEYQVAQRIKYYIGRPTTVVKDIQKE
jgi:hypothetical protein